jgi:hypothetical protein
MDDGAVDVNKLCGAQLLVRLTGKASTSSSQRHGGEAGNGESKNSEGAEEDHVKRGGNASLSEI